MKKLRKIIEDHLDDFPAYEYYFQHMEQAEEMCEDYPDIAIELCYSLFQGISKTIILNLSNNPAEHLFKDKRNSRHQETSTLFSNAQKCLDIHEELLKNTNSEDYNILTGITKQLCHIVSNLRNNRGDICHGRSAPKELKSDPLLASVIMELTSNLLFLTLKSYYIILIEKNNEEITYEDYPDFNKYLDEKFPSQEKIIYSEALYKLYPEDYRIQLNSYLDEIEEE